MIESFMSEHCTDHEGNQAGGTTSGDDFEIRWQDGHDEGASVETIIAVCIDRLRFYQTGRFPSEFNKRAIAHLTNAISALDERTADREQRGVEGTHAR